MPDPATLDYIKQNYGSFAYLLSNPEMDTLLSRAAFEQWSTEKLQAAVEQTDWWRTHSASQRQFDQLAATDPATTRARVAEEVATLQQAAQKEGVQLDAGRVQWMAVMSLRDGWTDQERQAALSAEAKYVPGKAAAGNLAALESQFAQMAYDYGIYWDQQSAALYVNTFKNQDPQAAIESVRDQFKKQAASRYPALAAPIDAGVTVRQYMDPYIQDASKILERPADSFNLSDQLFQHVLGQIDPKTGNKIVMSQSQAQDYFRSQPEYQYTDNAKQAAASLGNTILQKFGVVGG